MEFPLALVAEPIDRIAARHDLPIEAWDEDGLGPSRGVALWLPSQRPIALTALELAPRSPGVTEPEVLIEVDAGDLATLGVEVLLGEILSELGIPRDVVTGQQETHVQHRAARHAEWAVAYRESRARGEPAPPFPSPD